MKFGKFGSIQPKWGWLRITKNKTFHYQLEFDKFNEQPMEISLHWTTKQDHAGITFNFSIYKLFWLEFSLNDNRHWNYDDNNWENPEDCNYQESKWELPADSNS